MQIEHSKSPFLFKYLKVKVFEIISQKKKKNFEIMSFNSIWSLRWIYSWWFWYFSQKPERALRFVQSRHFYSTSANCRHMSMKLHRKKAMPSRKKDSCYKKMTKFRLKIMNAECSTSPRHWILGGTIKICIPYFLLYPRLQAWIWIKKPILFSQIQGIDRWQHKPDTSILMLYPTA